MASYGVWAEGYGDYEERRDVRIEGTTGSQTTRYSSWGVLSGVDHTYFRAPGEGIMLGGLAGYNNTHGNLGGDLNVGNSPRTQDIDGAILGLYGSYFYRGFAIDVLAKTDIFDFDQKIQIQACFPTGTGSTSLTDLLVASNIYYRYNMGHYWLEPTAGFRYIHSYFGDGAAALGVGDGDALRLQAGLRVGTDWIDVERRLWSVSFLAGVYSDVIVNGFTAGGGGVTLETDEGKVRAIGQLRAKVTTQNGLTYYGQAEIRGGEDYIGVAGKLGVRYDW
jgi:outer membrane autotransporter protein